MHAVLRRGDRQTHFCSAFYRVSFGRLSIHGVRRVAGAHRSAGCVAWSLRETRAAPPSYTLEPLDSSENVPLVLYSCQSGRFSGALEKSIRPLSLPRYRFRTVSAFRPPIRDGVLRVPCVPLLWRSVLRGSFELALLESSGAPSVSPSRCTSRSHAATQRSPHGQHPGVSLAARRLEKAAVRGCL